MNELNNSSWFLKESKMHVFSKKGLRNGIIFYQEKKISMAYRWLFYE